MEFALTLLVGPSIFLVMGRLQAGLAPRTFAEISVAAALLAAIWIFGGTVGVARANQSCSPPRGPGDNLVHSTNLRAKRTSCRIARRVVLVSTAHPDQGFSVSGHEWTCRSTPFPDSHERCSSDHHRLVTIIWID
jgi:hypothetical protein